MCGGSSKSTSSTDQSTKVTTETNTTIEQIGLVGADVAQVAAILQEGATVNAVALTDEIGPILTETARGFNKVGEAAKSIAEQGKTPTQLVVENAPLLLATAGVIAFVFRKQLGLRT